MADLENGVVADAQNVEAERQKEEKLFNQTQVNGLIGREKAAVAEKVRREMQAQYEAELNALRQQQEQRNEQVPRDIDADAIYKQVQEKFNQEMEERKLRQQMEQVANNYLNNVAKAKDNYEDFETVTKDFDPTAFPQLTFLLSGLDNAGDVLYELAKNPTKLSTIDHLSQKSPQLAQSELQRMAKSITDNRQAQLEAQSQQTAAPLDRLQPSRIAGNNGKMSIRDLRNQPWLRG